MRQAPEPNITVIFKSSLITVLTAKTRSEFLGVYLCMYRIGWLRGCKIYCARYAPEVDRETGRAGESKKSYEITQVGHNQRIYKTIFWKKAQGLPIDIAAAALIRL